MYRNYNDSPWMPNHRKDVNGKMMCYMKCFAMGITNMYIYIGEMYNGMSIDPHTHPNKQITTVVESECDYWVDGMPYRLASGCWVNVPPRYVHYAHVYRSQGPCYQMDVTSPKRPSSCDKYKAWPKAELDIDWDAGGWEVSDLTEPQDKTVEVCARADTAARAALPGPGCRIPQGGKGTLTMKARNLVREKTAQSSYAFSAFVASSSAMNCEILGLNGLDSTIIDREHVETNAETIVHMCRASEPCGMVPLVRVYDLDDGPMMSRMLDVGVHDVMAPLISAPVQAQNLISFTKYVPRGKRGVNGSCSPRWDPYDDCIHAANEDCLTIVQCEPIEGLESVEKIAVVPGLDAILIGTGDLSLEMGIAFRVDSSISHMVGDPQIVAAIDRVLATYRKNNVIPGTVTANAEDAARWIRQGFQFVTCMNDLGLFRSRGAQHIASVWELAAR